MKHRAVSLWQLSFLSYLVTWLSPIPSLLLCTKCHWNWWLFCWDMAISRFSRWQISGIINFTGPIMGSLKSLCRSSRGSSIETTALNFVVFLRKLRFYVCILASAWQTHSWTTNRWTALMRKGQCSSRKWKGMGTPSAEARENRGAIVWRGSIPLLSGWGVWECPLPGIFFFDFLSANRAFWCILGASFNVSIRRVKQSQNFEK